MSANAAALLYLASGVLFILALRGLSSPETSRSGNLFGMAGMAIAIVTTLAQIQSADSVFTWLLIIAGIGIGGGIGAYTARRIPMTMMPELVAAFHSLVGLAKLACIARMHRQTIGAAVDLRCADFYELAQFRIKPGLIDIRLQGSHGLKRGRAYLGDVNSLLHG